MGKTATTARKESLATIRSVDKDFKTDIFPTETTNGIVALLLFVYLRRDKIY